MINQSVPLFEASPRFVRVDGRTPEGFVQFAFSVADPELNVELIMPELMFEAFCSVNHVRFLPPEIPAPDQDA
ncbi:phenol hydroxylase P0 protein [Cupriavidus basilensis OR16]|uniref:Phenol hydroxylase P0 protein n=1 Tax=Cupriavidus basilensis OR16 TaxID=1127483 RepID=H1S570_9BURK|nr:phenol hydroxylase subunit [Cupriavidus basilensis]EHP42421.1 phenol hydroxylase P0 protein [Cupriavidus basilensis OR16]